LGHEWCRGGKAKRKSNGTTFGEQPTEEAIGVSGDLSTLTSKKIKEGIQKKLDRPAFEGVPRNGKVNIDFAS